MAVTDPGNPVESVIREEDIDEKPRRKSKISKEDLVKDVKLKLIRAADHRDNQLVLRTAWEKYYKFYRGDQWSALTASWVPKVGPNVCRMFVEMNTAMLTARGPEYSTRALRPEDEDMAAIMDEVMRFTWHSKGFVLPLRMAIKGAGIFGTGFLKVLWDVGQDNIVWKYVPCMNLYVDPLATCIEDADYLIQVTLARKNDLEERYGVKVEAGVDSEYETAAEIESGYKPPGSLHRVFEAWLDKGRYVAVIAGNELLKFDENPLQTFPYARIVDCDYENKFFGSGIIEDIWRNQKELNERRAQIHAWAKLTAWPKWRVTPGMGVDPNRLSSNMPNEVIYGEDGSVAPIVLPMMPPFLLQTPGALLREMEIITGIQQISQGRQVPQLTAAAAIERMQEASQMRVESKTAALEQALMRAGRLTLDLMKLNYTDEDVMPFLSAEQQSRFMAMGGMEAIRGMDFQMVVQPGSTLSKSQGALLQLGMQLFMNKVIDAKALLDVAEWPNRDSILQRMMGILPGFNGLAQPAGGPQAPSMAGGQMQAQQAPGPVNPRQAQGQGQNPMSGMSTQQLEQMAQRLQQQMGQGGQA